MYLFPAGKFVRKIYTNCHFCYLSQLVSNTTQRCQIPRSNSVRFILPSRGFGSKCGDNSNCFIQKI